MIIISTHLPEPFLEGILCVALPNPACLHSLFAVNMKAIYIRGITRSKPYIIIYNSPSN